MGNNGWSRVTYKGQTAYMYTKLLTTSAATGDDRMTQQMAIANGLKEWEYTKDSWKGVADALKAAKKLENSKNTDKRKAAADALEKAMASLVSMNYSALEEVIAKAKEQISSHEAYDMVDRLREAVTKGEQLRFSGDQDQVDATAELIGAMVEELAALREQNTDVLGWIVIPNTKVSYPLVQGEDNDYYLNHTWRKTRSVVGAIFMEQQSSADLTDFNTIIYGHRMNNRSMFGRLLDYKKQSYWQDHPRFYITDDSGTHTYEIFAAYEPAVGSTPYCIRFSNDTEKQTFINYGLEHSVIETGVVPEVTDRIVTLSTCTGNGHATRWVVQGVERVETVEEAEELPPAEEAPLPAEEPGPAGEETAEEQAETRETVEHE